MTATLADEEWNVIAALLPAEWRELARSTGAIRRDRGITDPSLLLQLLLLHAATGLSLKQTVARASEAHLPDGVVRLVLMGESPRPRLGRPDEAELRDRRAEVSGVLVEKET